MSVPEHVAIIMDGNGRWAQLKGRPRVYGHIRGSAQVRPIIRECGRLGVKYLTLYAFSAENWGRPSQEIGVLMRLLQKYLVRERKTLMQNNVRLKTIGATDSLPLPVLNSLRETIALTANNTGLTLTFALSYGSRQEIIAAVKSVAAQVLAGTLSVDGINDQSLGDALMTHDMPDPDLIIRTSGEHRVSNFLLWQSAYSEFYFIDKLWPDFTVQELHVALENFASRKRRFGLTSNASPDEADRRPGSSTILAGATGVGHVSSKIGERLSRTGERV